MGYGSYFTPGGKQAGYMIEATCEHPGCDQPIDRGLSFACGRDVGDQGGCSCEGYFCEKHLYVVETLPDTHARTELGQYTQLCAQCVSQAAFLDWIDEAEHYRADPKFAPDERTLYVLRTEDCPYIEPNGSSTTCFTCGGNCGQC